MSQWKTYYCSVIMCVCVKSVHIRSFSFLCFPAFGLNTERSSVSLRIHSECGKIRTRKTLNTDTFHAVCVYVYVFLNTFPANISLLYQWKQRFFREFCTETEHYLEMGCYLRVNDNKGLWFLLCSKSQRNRNGFEFLVNILKIED